MAKPSRGNGKTVWRGDNIWKRLDQLGTNEGKKRREKKKGGGKINKKYAKNVNMQWWLPGGPTGEGQGTVRKTSFAG